MNEEDKQSNTIVAEFATYEDFLDSQITQQDLFYLEDEELARQLVELGYRGNGEVLKSFGAQNVFFSVFLLHINAKIIFKIMTL